MATPEKKSENRYVNDLRRMDYTQAQFFGLRSIIVPIGLAVLFLAIVALLVGGYQTGQEGVATIVVVAAVVGGYMALNIGANDVANNMGPVVGGKVITVFWAVVIAAICESAGALLAGGDVINTVSKEIINPNGNISNSEFRSVMLAALFAAGLWINLATWLSAPVSTTHSIVGGVLGAGIAAAGFGLVNWGTMAQIAASWVVSPVLGAIIAASLLMFIKAKVLDAEDRVEAAKKWVPVLIAIMAGAYMAYMATKGLDRIWQASTIEVLLISAVVFAGAYLASKPYIVAKTVGMENTRHAIYVLFNVPLIIGVALLSFAHGANDVANAVGPLAAIVSTLSETDEAASVVAVPHWVMLVGAVGIACGLTLFGPKLIRVVGEKITRLNSPRVYCIALSSAITVLIASWLGLPVSSTHIAVGAVFGVGFLREYTEDPNKKKLRPGHKVNATAEEAFLSADAHRKRLLVRRSFAVSIAAAWIITVPMSALIAAIIFWLVQLF